jgi:hypothetical protein
LSVGVAGQQNTQLFKAFANGGNGLRQVQVALRGAACGVAVGLRISGVNAAARKHIGPRRKAGRGGAARHQHFWALWAIAQQQHGGGGQEASGLLVGVKALGSADHTHIMKKPKKKRLYECLPLRKTRIRLSYGCHNNLPKTVFIKE